MQGFVIQSSRRPEDIVRALADVGREWRESAQPPAIRAAGGLGVKVNVTPSSFYLRMRGVRRRLAPACVGRIIRTPTGSRIEARFALARSDRVASLVAVVCFGVIVWFARGLRAEAASLAVILLGATTATQWALASDERHALKSILDHVAEAQSDGGSPRAAS